MPRIWRKGIIGAFCILFYCILNGDIPLLTNISRWLEYQPLNKNFYSSVSCHGSNHSIRVCLFQNLYYYPPSDNFLFFHSPESVIEGVPEDRFDPALTDFSSVHDHNTQYFNFVDIPYSASSSFNIKFINGASVIFKRFNPENIMHVFHDDLIPAFVTINEFFTINQRNLQLVFADGKKPGPYSHLYDNFLVKKPLYLNSSLTHTLCFETAIVGLNKNSLWYQYGFKKPQGPLNKNLSVVYPHIFNFRSYFFKRFHIKITSPKTELALILTRENNRKLLNLGDVAEIVTKNLQLKTAIMSLEKFSVIDIVQKIVDCKLVIGVHGSLLILSLFLPQKSYIIELFPYGVNPDISTPYRTLTKVSRLEITYQSWENKIEENSFPHPEFPAELGGILHLPIEEQELIKKSIVKPFLCCYDPVWLYRIYQDTFVDSSTLSDVIDDILKKNQTEESNIDITQRLYPSEVQNISCTLTTSDFFLIKWNSPWNVQFLNNTFLEYELWYQNGYEDVKAFIMKKNHFTFEEKVLRSVYVWIRCYMNNKMGPFNSDPLICQKHNI